MKFNLNRKRKLSGIQNLLSFMDYGYMDTDIAYQKALRINEVILDKPSFSHDRPANEKIRIGYVSSDFSNHAVSNFILPILKNHDHDRFEVYTYVAQPKQTYEAEYIQAIIRNIFDLDDLAAAKQIHSDRIDILVDLNGHTANSRIAVFAFRPAPIQISYIGYPNTTGLSAIHYRITDSVADHTETRQKYSETLIRLPKCFLLYESIGQTSPITPRKTGPVIILGALNKEKKNTTYVLETWKRVLKECPTVKLLIKLDGYDDIVARTEFYMKELGVEKTRLLIFPKTSDADYLRLFTMIDILLDTFPYSGTTTTCNTLYNSIPVVSHYHKDYHAHNVSSSILIHSGFPELVSYSRDEYVDIIKNLTSNPGKIDEYKRIIGPKFIQLMCARDFMKTYEARLDALVRTNQTKDSVIEIRL
jgi:predicted O-linked N-acetylglucosamine transferase (SPINDLY family)